MGVEWLQSSSVEWQRRNNCFGCHVQGQVLMGLSVAEINHYDVNSEYANELFQDIEKRQNPDGSFHDGHHVTATQFAAMGLAWVRKVRPNMQGETVLSATEWLADRQGADGSLAIDHNLPPIDQGTIVTTANSLMAFRNVYDETGDKRFQKAAENAFGWLETAPVSTTQDVVFQLLAVSHAKTPEAEARIDGLVQHLREEQHTDGGWKETPQMGGSNAYATGQVLYAFKQAEVSVNDSDFREGVVFLLDNQKLDGSWPAANTQSHRPSDFAPTMWAVIGLAGGFGSIVPRLAEVDDCGWVDGRVTLSAAIKNYTDSTVKQVVFEVDSTELSGAQKVGDGAWTAEWNSEVSPEGRHSVRVTATNRDGLTGDDSSVFYTGQQFTAKVLNPSVGTAVQGLFTCTVQVTNPAGVPIERVDFFLGEALLASASEPPWQAQCDFSDHPGGVAAVRAVAVGCGRQSEDSVEVTVAPVSGLGSLEIRLQGVTEQVVYLPPEAIEIVLDMSRSMWGTLGDRRKYEIAREVLGKVVRGFPSDANLAMRVYGHRREADCSDSELMVPLRRVEPEQLISGLEGLRPKGKTPIDYSLRQALEDLRGLEGTKAVILVSDGIETCGGNPVEASRVLLEAGLDLKVHVVGFDVLGTPQAVEQLKQVAEAGGGRFFLAENADQLSQALQEAVRLNYSVWDDQGNLVVTHPVGSPLEIMSGSYRVEIDASPPLRLDAVQVERGGSTVIELARDAGNLVAVPSAQAAPVGRIQ